MRAIVLKNHYESTAGLAYLVRLVVPDFQVFGGIDLNLTVGGINPAAVEHMTRVSGGWGRVVWMPTFDAENQVRFSKEKRPFVAVSRNGELVPEVREVISIIAKHGLVLATGHSSQEEGLMLLREGRAPGRAADGRDARDAGAGAHGSAAHDRSREARRLHRVRRRIAGHRTTPRRA